MIEGGISDVANYDQLLARNTEFHQLADLGSGDLGEAARIQRRRPHP